MRIVEQGYTIENPTNGWGDIINIIEDAGRTCYQSESKGDPEKFISRLIRSGHHSVIEHANMTVRFITDRGVTHELVRHRISSFSQSSTRYCDYADGNIEFIRPVWLPSTICDVWNYGRFDGLVTRLVPYNEDALDNLSAADYNFLNMLATVEQGYKYLREAGWKPEKARTVLPNSLAAEIVMTANLREWRHVLDLRCSKAAHPQIRELMLPLLVQMKKDLPCVFSDIYEKHGLGND